MALTYVYAVSPSGATVMATPPGGLSHPYTPNAAGIVTGVAPADALYINSLGGTGLKLLCATGLTADRPLPATAPVSPGPNYSYPAPVLWDVYIDTTLNQTIFYAGNRSTTGWINSAGAAV